MEGKTPFEKLKDLGYDLPEESAVFPPVILDAISTDWLLETGNDVLAHYKLVPTVIIAFGGLGDRRRRLQGNSAECLVDHISDQQVAVTRHA